MSDLTELFSRPEKLQKTLHAIYGAYQPDHCPVCNSINLKMLTARAIYRYDVPGKMRQFDHNSLLFRCNQCDHVFTADTPPG